MCHLPTSRRGGGQSRIGAAAVEPIHGPRLDVQWLPMPHLRPRTTQHGPQPLLGTDGLRVFAAVWGVSGTAQRMQAEPRVPRPLQSLICHDVSRSVAQVLDRVVQNVRNGGTLASWVTTTACTHETM